MEEAAAAAFFVVHDAADIHHSTTLAPGCSDIRACTNEVTQPIDLVLENK
jgi:hypothetical protein